MIRHRWEYARHRTRVWLIRHLIGPDLDPMPCAFPGCAWVGWYNDAGLWGAAFFCPEHTLAMDEDAAYDGGEG